MSSSWVDEAEAAGAKVATGGALDGDGVLRPTVITDAKPDMKVCSHGGLRTCRGDRRVRRPRRCVRAGQRLRRSGFRRRSSPPTSARRCKAFTALDYGGVLVNEVPTWRADQQPYGGMRDSGNTREGPAYSVKEMTELRTGGDQPLRHRRTRWSIIPGTPTRNERELWREATTMVLYITIVLVAELAVLPARVRGDDVGLSSRELPRSSGDNDRAGPGRLVRVPVGREGVRRRRRGRGGRRGRRAPLAGAAAVAIIASMPPCVAPRDIERRAVSSC